ncbi:hypothetical protein E5288_WYG009339 [Bos mutus]|uniref:Uncharacterized protein n=1 Tax=Bos mutus TaxID=72004 RepID=A0A6B0S3V3_9CETA|nr:hypothetical protein [Bos mutus]
MQPSVRTHYTLHPDAPHWTPLYPLHLQCIHCTPQHPAPTAHPLNPTGPPLREVTARTPWDSGILLPLTDKHPRNRLHPSRLLCDTRVHSILVNQD